MTPKGALATREDFQPVIQLVLDGLTSTKSRRAYQKALTDFFDLVAGLWPAGVHESPGAALPG